MRGNFVYKRLGGKISKQRRVASLSQEQVSMACHVDRTYIGRLEQGKANPSLRVMIKVARALKISLSDLLDGITIFIIINHIDDILDYTDFVV